MSKDENIKYDAYIKRLTKIYDKAMNIINGCITHEQLNGAFNYVKLFSLRYPTFSNHVFNLNMELKNRIGFINQT